MAKGKKLKCKERFELFERALMATSTLARKARTVEEYGREIRRFSVLLEHFMGRDDEPSPGVTINEKTILKSIEAADSSIPEVRELLEHIAEESPYEAVRNAAKEHRSASKE